MTGKGFGKLSILVPAYNEKHTLTALLEQLLRLPIDKEIIIVDDGSSDGTAGIVRDRLQDTDCIKLFHIRNEGKGAAIRTALKKATGQRVVIQDADLEYDPRDILKLLKAAEEGGYAVVYGSRFMKMGRRLSLFNRLANVIVTGWVNIIYGTHLTDVETCYKMLNLCLAKDLNLREKRFGIDPELTTGVLRRGIKIYEVPVSYEPRTKKEGKKITWVDGLWALWVVSRSRMF
ncbi:MAG: glycosyltransferase family 2 protein [Candidatus Omnitrophica bacterium]|nr:glycosyltransferase family 2 protein [Candidatus Omnitrophota bacterium]